MYDHGSREKAAAGSHVKEVDVLTVTVGEDVREDDEAFCWIVDRCEDNESCKGESTVSVRIMGGCEGSDLLGGIKGRKN